MCRNGCSQSETCCISGTTTWHTLSYTGIVLNSNSTSSPVHHKTCKRPVRQQAAVVCSMPLAPTKHLQQQPSTFTVNKPQCCPQLCSMAMAKAHYGIRFLHKRVVDVHIGSQERRCKLLSGRQIGPGHKQRPESHHDMSWKVLTTKTKAHQWYVPSCQPHTNSNTCLHTADIS